MPGAGCREGAWPGHKGGETTRADGGRCAPSGPPRTINPGGRAAARALGRRVGAVPCPGARSGEGRLQARGSLLNLRGSRPAEQAGGARSPPRALDAHGPLCAGRAPGPSLRAAPRSGRRRRPCRGESARPARCQNTINAGPRPAPRSLLARRPAAARRLGCRPVRHPPPPDIGRHEAGRRLTGEPRPRPGAVAQRELSPDRQRGEGVACACTRRPSCSGVGTQGRPRGERGQHGATCLRAQHAPALPGKCSNFNRGTTSRAKLSPRSGRPVGFPAGLPPFSGASPLQDWLTALHAHPFAAPSRPLSDVFHT